MTDEMRDLAERLTDAQRRYLLALEPNRISETAEPWIQDVEREFLNRSHAKPMGRPGLDTAHVLIRKGLVKHFPEPCECGRHYASLTSLGLQVQDYLRTRTQETTGGR